VLLWDGRVSFLFNSSQLQVLGRAYGWVLKERWVGKRMAQQFGFWGLSCTPTDLGINATYKT